MDYIKDWICACRQPNSHWTICCTNCGCGFLDFDNAFIRPHGDGAWDCGKCRTTATPLPSPAPPPASKELITADVDPGALERAVAVARADIARTDTKAQIASAAILATALAVAPAADDLTAAAAVVAAGAAIAGAVAVAAAGLALWPRAGAPTGAATIPPEAELTCVRALAKTKFTAIRCAYIAAAVAIAAAVTALAL